MPLLPLPPVQEQQNADHRTPDGLRPIERPDLLGLSGTTSAAARGVDAQAPSTAAEFARLDPGARAWASGWPGQVWPHGGGDPLMQDLVDQITAVNAWNDAGVV